MALRQKCRQLEKDSFDTEKARGSLQALDLKTEQLDHSLEVSKAEREKLTQQVSTAQVQAAQTEVINLKQTPTCTTEASIK
jgi:predicted RNase H-like nuclease (RuvC/YqgF family)